MTTRRSAAPFLLAFGLAAVASCGGSGSDCGKVYRGGAFARDDGTAILSGRVTFPMGTPEGLGFQVFVEETSLKGARYGVFPADLFSVPDTCGGGMSYEVTRLRAGEYLVSAEVHKVDDPDIVYYQGYYAGTVEAPLASSAGARPVTVAGTSVAGIDFGLAKTATR